MNTSANRAQSTSATVTQGDDASRPAVPCPEISRPTAWPSATTASSGGRARRPRRRRYSAASPRAAMPASAHGPQAMAVAARPRALRLSARASREALAAA